MDEDDTYEIELTADRAEIAAALNAVADGVRTGAVHLGSGTDAVSVETPDELSLEIELEAEPEEMSLELELEWPISGDESAVSPVEGEPEPTDTTDALVGAADKSRSLARFEVYQARDEEWRWRLRHNNGNIIATSGEGYTRKHNAVKGLRSVMENSADAAITGEFTK